MNTNRLSLLYAAVLHVAAMTSLVVLMSLGKLTVAVGLPILNLLFGFAIGLPVNANQPPDPPISK